MKSENLKVIIEAMGKLEKVSNLKQEDFLQNVVVNLVDNCIEKLSFALIDEDVCPQCGCSLKNDSGYRVEETYEYLYLKKCVSCNEQYEVEN